MGRTSQLGFFQGWGTPSSLPSSCRMAMPNIASSHEPTLVLKGFESTSQKTFL